MSKHKWLKGRPSVCALCGYVEGNLMTHEQLKCDNGFPPLARILIEFINHSQQRYDTCGDYFLSDHPDMPSAGEVLHVKVSRLPDRREMLLVAIHELCEWAMADTAGVTNEEIDKFDMEFESRRDPEDKTEPGDVRDCPVYHFHQISTGIERILAAELGVDWLTYSRHIEELSYNNPPEPLP